MYMCGRLLNPYGEIGFVYPTMSMMVIGSCFLYYVRQRWCCLPDGCYVGDQNNWNTISVSGKKNTLTNPTLNNQTSESNKRKNRMNNR